MLLVCKEEGVEQRWGVQGQGREVWLPQPQGEDNILMVLSRESDLPSLCLGSVLPNFEVKIIPENPYILAEKRHLSLPSPALTVFLHLKLGAAIGIQAV